MSTEVKEEKKVVAKPVVYVNAFVQGYDPNEHQFFAPQAEKDVIIKLKLDFDPKTGSTTPNEDEKIDLVPLIQSYKDQCGMEYVQKLLRTGYATPDKFADDGKHGGDATLPTDINDASRLARKAASGESKLAKALGIDLEKATEEDIAKRIAEIYGAMNKQEAPKAEENK